MENKNKQKTPKKPISEEQVRLHIRRLAIEHFAKNGLANLSPKEVQRRLLVIEAKASKHITSRAKEDKKLLGSKKSIGNSAANAKWMLGKRKESKATSGSVGGSKMAGLKTHQMQPGSAHFGVSKPGKEMKDGMKNSSQQKRV